MECCDTLAKGAQLLESLRMVKALDGTKPWSFLQRWGLLTEQEKAEHYSKHACHELHCFLSRKDIPFFETVVAPHLRNKHEVTSSMQRGFSIATLFASLRSLSNHNRATYPCCNVRERGVLALHCPLLCPGPFALGLLPGLPCPALPTLTAPALPCFPFTTIPLTLNAPAEALRGSLPPRGGRHRLLRDRRVAKAQHIRAPAPVRGLCLPLTLNPYERLLLCEVPWGCIMGYRGME